MVKEISSGCFSSIEIEWMQMNHKVWMFWFISSRGINSSACLLVNFGNNLRMRRIYTWQNVFRSKSLRLWSVSYNKHHYSFDCLKWFPRHIVGCGISKSYKFILHGIELDWNIFGSFMMHCILIFFIIRHFWK